MHSSIKVILVMLVVSSTLLALKRESGLRTPGQDRLDARNQDRAASYPVLHGQQAHTPPNTEKLHQIRQVKDFLSSDGQTLNKAGENGMYHLVETLGEYTFFDPPLKTKTNYQWDGFHNQVRLIEQEWNGGSYDNSYMAEWEYDLDQNLLVESSFLWENMAWEKTSYTEYFYTSLGMLDHWTYHGLYNGNWLEGNTDTYYYDLSGNVIKEVLTYKDDASNTQNYYQLVYTYDANNNRTSEEFQFWDGTKFDPSWGYQQSYDENSNAILGEYFSYIDGIKVVDYREHSTYDGNNNLTLLTSEYWDYDNSEWVGDYKAELSYNNKNQQTQSLGYVPDGLLWVLVNRGSFSYDNNGNQTLWLLEATDNAGTNWYTLVREDHTYAFTVTSVDLAGTELPGAVKLNQNFPNPFNPSTTIEFSLAESGNINLVIFDLRGRQIASILNGLKDAGSYSINLNASGLANGTYIYQLTTGQQTFTRKMTLLK